MKQKKRANTLLALLLIALLALGIVIFALLLKNHLSSAGDNAQPSITTSIPQPTPIEILQPSPTPSTKPTPKPRPTHTSTAKPEAILPSPEIHQPARVAIIIDDFGDDSEIEQQILALPFPLTISVLPQRSFTQKMALEVQARHKTLLLHLPMEPMSRRDGSTLTKIKPGMSQEEITQIIEADLAQVPGAVGINNHEGSKATADPETMGKVMKVIKEKNLCFIDSYTSSVSVADGVAAQYGIPHARRKVFLDNQNESWYVRQQLEDLLKTAEQDGQAIGIGHPRSATVKVLQEELGGLLKKYNIELVPVTELVKTNNEN